MNIFFLHRDPEQAAKEHVDKHVVKMIVEYAQLLSTAHRMIDGSEYTDYSKNGRKVKRYKLENPNAEKLANELRKKGMDAPRNDKEGKKIHENESKI